MLYRVDDDITLNTETGAMIQYPKHASVLAWIATLPHVSELGKRPEPSPVTDLGDNCDPHDVVCAVLTHLGLPFNDLYSDDARDIIAAIDALKSSTAKAPASLVERAKKLVAWLNDPCGYAPEQSERILRDLAALSGDAVQEACPVDVDSLRYMARRGAGSSDVADLASWALRVGGGK